MLQKLFLFLTLPILIVSEHLSFSGFIKKFNKEYANDEIISRYQIYKDNLVEIERHNAEGHSWQKGVTIFADLTAEEFKAQISRPIIPKQNPIIFRGNMEEINIENLPDTVDWVSKGAVTTVKDQAQCGSCWAFSSIESVESAWFLKHGTLPVLSEQQLVDCSGKYGNQGCNGGMMDQSFQYIIDNKGICSESSYPYKAADGKCRVKKCKSIVTISSFKDVIPNSESMLMTAVVQQPISIAIEADQSVFQLYTSGVITNNCGVNLDHGVQVVGYGTLNGVQYWKVRNSWGISWGMQGYFLIGRNITGQSLQGVCGLLSMPSYPVV